MSAIQSTWLTDDCGSRTSVVFIVVLLTANCKASRTGVAIVSTVIRRVGEWMLMRPLNAT